VAGLRSAYGIADRRRQPAAPPPKAEQLALLGLFAPQSLAAAS
jgi:hypothetical protein